MSSKFTIVECDQRSAAWRDARIGRLTSSRANDFLSEGRTKGSEGTQRKNLRWQLALERLCGRSLDRDFQSQAMTDGVAREADALRLYEATTGVLLRRCGFLSHTELMAGASLDAYIGTFQRIVEAKSPIPATHGEFLRTGVVPLDYRRQIVHQLFVSGAEACDYISYQPDFPERLRLRIVTVPREAEAMEAHEKAVRAFLAEVDREVDALLTMADPAGTLRRAAEAAA
jgi:YqaJ-like recombinase protein